MVEWEIHGIGFGNCNCAYGCPCQFNALPTHGHCRAISFTEIERGYFGATDLAGLRLAFAAIWPGPVHEGNGTYLPIVDRRADADQRAALVSILTGKETDPLATAFAVYSAMCSTVHEAVVTEIDIEIDMEARTARCEARGVAEVRGEPIRNPVTGAEHRVGIVLPNGFEFTRNECGRGWGTTSEPVAMRLDDTYASWAETHLNRRGIVRS
jgi:hypothetical protein